MVEVLTDSSEWTPCPSFKYFLTFLPSPPFRHPLPFSINRWFRGSRPAGRIAGAGRLSPNQALSILGPLLENGSMRIIFFFGVSGWRKTGGKKKYGYGEQLKDYMLIGLVADGRK